MTNPDAWSVVSSFGSAVTRGDHSLGAVPGLLKRLLAEELWREFPTPRGEVVRHERFVDFLTTPPTHGVGTSVDLVRRVIGDDPEALDLLDRALQEKHGGDRSKSANSNVDRPSGTTREAALRRLRKDNPDLHAEVLAGHLTAHAAMVQAGHRPRTATIRLDDPHATARALRRAMPADAIAALVKLLSEEV